MLQSTDFCCDFIREAVPYFISWPGPGGVILSVFISTKLHDKLEELLK